MTRKASGYVVGVSDFLMTSLARLTVYVGKEVMTTVAESKVRGVARVVVSLGTCTCTYACLYVHSRTFSGT